ncbi:MAG: hypothetical protein ACJAVN_000383 [Roseivirga sp.]|jgi:hypothetical protein
MIKLFNWKKPNLKSITLPELGLIEGDTTKSIKKWGDADGTMAISLNFFEGEPDISSLKTIDGLRQYYRDTISSSRGAIIEVELVVLHGVQCIRTVLKFPQDPSGSTYLTSLIIPFAMCSYVVKIQAPELDLSGVRESFIIKKLVREEVISKTPTGYSNWAFDPYKPDFMGPNLMHRSEDVKWDVRFPSHPLTKSRKLMAEIEKGIQFDQKLLDLKPFDK